MHSPRLVERLKDHALAVLFVLLALSLTLALQAVASRTYSERSAAPHDYAIQKCHNRMA